MNKLFLFCGIIAVLIYVGSDIFAAIQWREYSYVNQTVSELRAIGSPTRAFLIPTLLIYSALEIVFGIGVFKVADQNQALRITGLLLIGLGILDLIALIFPMQGRGSVISVTDFMHIILTIVTVFLFLSILGFGSYSLGKWFRIYTIITAITIIVFGILGECRALELPKSFPHLGWAFMNGSISSVICCGC